MLSVGKYKIPEMDETTMKMSTGFAGGIGDSRQELCGAFSAGIMVIGALYGRSLAEDDDSICFQKTLQYQNQFEQVIGSISCPALRRKKYGSGGLEPCSVLVSRAARELLNVL